MSPSAARQTNASGGPWLVQTFGGAGLARHLDTIAGQIIPSALSSGKRVAVVCAARAGSASTQTGTTNLLLRAAHQALHSSPADLAASIVSLPSRPPSPPSSNSSSRERDAKKAADQQEFNLTVDTIKQQHLDATSVVRDDLIRAQLQEDVSYECEKLRTLLMAAQIIEEMSPRSKDLVVGVGERLSARILTAVLQDRGIDAELVSLQNIVPEASPDDESDDTVEGRLSQSFYDRVSKRIAARIDECGSRVPVISGFFGPCPGGLLAQVGRGYSDLCAALCAVGLQAAELQAWKLVDGIFTADSRVVSTARLLAYITPEEAAELTFYGARFLNPLTAEQALRVGIPVRIVNVRKPSQEGTVITPSAARPPSPILPQLSELALSPPVHKGPTAVTIKHNVLVLSVKSNRKSVSHLFYSAIFGALDRHSVIVDLVSTSEVHLSLAINGNTIRKSVLDRVAQELTAVGEVTIKPDCATITLVGKNMAGVPGSFAKMFSCLAEGNINIEMISQEQSQINLSCIISDTESLTALRLVHDKLLK